MLIFLIVWGVCSLLSLGLGIYCWYKLFNEVTIGDFLFELTMCITGPVGLFITIVFYFKECSKIDFNKVILRKRK
jgi:hypothetical protein